MPKRLLFFKNGQTALAGHGHTISIGGQEPTTELDVTDATDLEVETLKKNPHNKALVDLIEKRRRKKV